MTKMANAQQQLQAALTEFKNAQRGELSSSSYILQQIKSQAACMYCIIMLCYVNLGYVHVKVIACDNDSIMELFNLCKSIQCQPCCWVLTEVRVKS